MQNRKKVAIVGSGCSGIAALWALKNTPHEVHLYEADKRLGGHTNTVDFQHEGQTTKVDTGFIVMNSVTYPNFLAFLKNIRIEPVPTDMTFAVSRDRGAMEWGGVTLSSLFAQKSNILRPSMWRMLFDIVRFNQFALDLLAQSEESEVDPAGANSRPNGIDNEKPRQRQPSIGEYLDRENYSDAFRNDYLIPMTAAVWSTAPDKASLEFPATTLVRFMWNHHLLTTVSARPTWMTILGGTKPYIDAVLKDFPKDRVHLGARVEYVMAQPNGKVILQTGGESIEYDHIILATHGDQALDIVRYTATPQEKKILSGFRTSSNIAVLHSDLSLMPTRPTTWSSWNYIARTPSPSSRPTVCLTYNMNILQHIPRSVYGDVLVTLNPLWPPRPSLTQGSWRYHHPLYNADAIHSQELLPLIQNRRGISYCGAWTKYGFHEDGFSSGLKVAVEHLGATLPFEFKDSTFSRGKRPVLGWRDYIVRILVLVVQILVNLVELGMAFTKRLDGEGIKMKSLKKTV